MISGDRHTLHLSKLDEFAEWAKSKGYLREETKGTYEVLRLRHYEGGKPLLFYARASAVEHASSQRDGLVLVRRWIKAKKQSEER